MAIIPNVSQARLNAGDLALGFGVYQMRGPAAATMAAACGYHWLSIDAEHGAFSASEIGDLCIAGLANGITPIVRVSQYALDIGRRALDNGAQGIIVPMVEDADQAQHLVRILRYSPTGHRGWGGRGPRGRC